MKRTLLALLLFPAVLLAQEGAPGKDRVAEPVEAEAGKKAEETAWVAEIELKLSPDEDPFGKMPFGPQRLNFLGYLNELKKASKDPAIDGVLLELESTPLGWARMMELRDALLALRKAGKKVFLYKENFTTRDLVLAGAADRVSMPETGMVVLPGLAIEMMYMKGLLEKLHVKFDVVHIGDFKTAGESFVRETMSEEQKKSLAPILDEFYATLTKSIAESRGLSEENVRKAIDRGILYGKEAKEAGLVDRIEYRDQFIEGMKANFPGKTVKKSTDYGAGAGMKIDPNNPMAAFSMMMAAMFGGQRERREPGPRIAVVYCTGPITSGKSQYDWSGNIASMGSETIVDAIDKARKDDDVKAIVLRVNSPGGSALASDMIWRAIARAKEKKPVIASMGDVAASGGYYISMNSDAIFAEPQTITGSIGVVGMVPNIDEFWPWVGISMQRMTRGKRAAALLTSKGLDEGDKEMLRKTMRSLYDDFVAKVAAGRGKTPEDIYPIAQGRVWTGRAAKENGLVDELGGLRDAIAFARTKAGLADADEVRLMQLPKRGGPLEALEKMFGGAEASGLDLELLKRTPELRRALLNIAAYKKISADRIALLHPELGALAGPVR